MYFLKLDCFCSNIVYTGFELSKLAGGVEKFDKYRRTA